MNPSQTPHSIQFSRATAPVPNQFSRATAPVPCYYLGIQEDQEANRFINDRLFSEASLRPKRDFANRAENSSKLMGLGHYKKHNGKYCLH